MNIRYTFGGDEHLFAECSEEMSLEAFFKSLSMTEAIKKENILGITEICPSNASFQVKFNPDIINYNDLLSLVQDIEKANQNVTSVIRTRIIELPVLYNDPWTYETMMRFRNKHQEPEGTDLQYAAKINSYESVDNFIKAHSSSPWFVTMVGFVAGLPFMYQMVEKATQIEVPKYLSPRTDTPKLTLGHGGCFSCIYSVKGAGGYQMFGVTPLPIYDPTQTVKYLREFMVFFRPGDIVKFKPIEMHEYERILAALEKDEYEPNIREVDFDLKKYQNGIEEFNNNLINALKDD